MFGGHYAIDLFYFLKEIEQLPRLEQVAFGFDPPTKKGFTATACTAPNLVEQVGF